MIKIATIAQNKLPKAMLRFPFAVMFFGLFACIGFFWHLVAIFRKKARLPKLVFAICDALGMLINAINESLDLLANAFAGEMLESSLSKTKNSTLGSGKATLSASIGVVEFRKKTTKASEKISKILDFIFKEKTHCKSAWVKNRMLNYHQRTIKK